MAGEPANEEKPSDEEWPLDRAEVGIYISNQIFAEFGVTQMEMNFLKSGRSLLSRKDSLNAKIKSANV